MRFRYSWAVPIRRLVNSVLGEFARKLYVTVNTMVPTGLSDRVPGRPRNRPLDDR